MINNPETPNRILQKVVFIIILPVASDPEQPNGCVSRPPGLTLEQCEPDPS
jgi:hypothetical protein